MKFAYYETAGTEEEKKQRIHQLREAHRGDESYYSAYIDVAPVYDERPYKRRGYISMINAIRKGKMDKVVMPDASKLGMPEIFLYDMIFGLRRKGIAFSVGEGETLFTSDMPDSAIRLKLYEQMMNYLLDDFFIPAFTDENCFISGWKVPFVYLEKDAEAARGRYSCVYKSDRKKPFIDALREYGEQGCWLYRRDLNCWYPVIPDAMQGLVFAYDEYNTPDALADLLNGIRADAGGEDLPSIPEELLEVEVGTAVITMEKCFVHGACTPRIYLAQDAQAARSSCETIGEGDKEMLFIDAIREHTVDGCILYHEKTAAWYRLKFSDMHFLKKNFDVFYEVVADSLGLPDMLL